MDVKRALSSTTAALSQPAILLKEVQYTHEGATAPTIQALSLTVAAGEWVAMIGASGSGKSTVCRLINGQFPRIAGGQRDGVVHVHGFDPALAHPSELVDVLGTLGQDPDAELVVGTVEDELAFGPENLRLCADEIGKRIDRLTAELELEHVRSQAVHRLSGGQRQRTALAAVLAMEPELLLLDEPAASLDPAGRQRVAKMISRWHDHGNTLVTASARWDELADAADRVIVLHAGKIVLDGVPSAIRAQHTALLEQLFILPMGNGFNETLLIETTSSETLSMETAFPHIAASIEETVSKTTVQLTSLATAQETTSAVRQQPMPALAAKTAPAIMQQTATEIAGKAKRPQHTESLHAEPPQAIAELRNLSYTYVGAHMPALQHINLKLFPGEMTLLCGANGSGKTTLTRLLTGLLQPPPGTIYRGTHDTTRDRLERRAQDTAYLFQHPDYQWVAATVWEECVFGLRAELRLRRRDALPEAYRMQVEQMLHHIGLLDQRDASPYSLSGGQKRLLAGAAQFLLARPLYILDEPGSAADYFTITRLLELCRAALRRGASLLVVTHEPELFMSDASCICTLEQGKMIVQRL
ncbi:ABC transporter ATP-binding protein [Paenibacillus campi]|uniref:ABC transporter ATP-binding protein n=1 Tax=Paenibacillus campi TaxID=3106031 RepID=UPI002AFF5D81|nr:ABC transporter ATP-binding protein [Paenibacillus sp. SGZ-1009]